MLFAELIPLCSQLREYGYHITIETAGTLYLPLTCDLMSISPKLSNSTPRAADEPRWHERHERTRHAPDVIRSLVRDYPYQMKFVVDTPADCREVAEYLAAFPEVDRGRVLLMPQGSNPLQLERTGEWLRAYCDEHQFQFCPRKHIEWFGLARGT